MCQAFYHILRFIKTRCTHGRLFYTQGPFFCTLGLLFCALVREEAIFAVCKRCANKVFACMCKEKYDIQQVVEIGLQSRVIRYSSSIYTAHITLDVKSSARLNWSTKMFSRWHLIAEFIIFSLEFGTLLFLYNHSEADVKFIDFVI